MPENDFNWLWNDKMLNFALDCQSEEEGWQEWRRSMLFSPLHLTLLSRVQIFHKMFFFNLTAPVTLCQGCIFQDFFFGFGLEASLFFQSRSMSTLATHSHFFYYHPGSCSSQLALDMNTGYWTLSSKRVRLKNMQISHGGWSIRDFN